MSHAAVGIEGGGASGTRYAWMLPPAWDGGRTAELAAVRLASMASSCCKPLAVVCWAGKSLQRLTCAGG